MHTPPQHNKVTRDSRRSGMSDQRLHKRWHARRTQVREVAHADGVPSHVQFLASTALRSVERAEWLEALVQASATDDFHMPMARLLRGWGKSVCSEWYVTPSAGAPGPLDARGPAAAVFLTAPPLAIRAAVTALFFHGVAQTPPRAVIGLGYNSAVVAPSTLLRALHPADVSCVIRLLPRLTKTPQEHAQLLTHASLGAFLRDVARGDGDAGAAAFVRAAYRKYRVHWDGLPDGSPLLLRTGALGPLARYTAASDAFGDAVPRVVGGKFGVNLLQARGQLWATLPQNDTSPALRHLEPVSDMLRRSRGHSRAPATWAPLHSPLHSISFAATRFLFMYSTVFQTAWLERAMLGEAFRGLRDPVPADFFLLLRPGPPLIRAALTPSLLTMAATDACIKQKRRRKQAAPRRTKTPAKAASTAAKRSSSFTLSHLAAHGGGSGNSDGGGGGGGARGGGGGGTRGAPRARD